MDLKAVWSVLGAKLRRLGRAVETLAEEPALVPIGESNPHPRIDIIFVHGLGGDASASWGASAQGRSWPSWLSSEFPTANVWALSWPAHAVHLEFLTGKVALEERAINILSLLKGRAIGNRPILFICHSLGGLLIKEVLRQSATLGEDSIAKSTVGVIFVGVPHTGSGLANAASLLLRRVMTPAARQLLQNDPHLSDLTNWYRKNADRSGYRTQSFYETRPVLGLGLIVAQDSADIRVGDVAVAIDGDHFTICKPPTRDSVLYGSTSLLIRELLASRHLSSSRLEAFRAYYLGTQATPRAFAGRNDTIKLLDTWLEEEGTASHGLLVAPTGRGKSALLVQWIERLKSTSDYSIAFVPISARFNTNSPSVFHELLARQLAGLLGVDISAPPLDATSYYFEKAHAFLTELANHETKVLVVIDGIDEAVDGAFDSSFIPSDLGGRVKVIVSARYQLGDRNPSGWKSRLNWDALPVKTIELRPLVMVDVADVLARIGVSDQGVRDRIWELTSGDPLMLAFYCDDIQEASLHGSVFTVADLKGLQPGLAAYFSRSIEHAVRDWNSASRAADLRNIENLLAIFACAYAPVYRDDVISLLRQIGGSSHAFSSLEITRLLEAVERFIWGSGGREAGYVLNHPALGQFLLEEYLPKEVVAGAKDAYIAWGLKQAKGAADQSLTSQDISPYLLQFLHKHLEDASASSENFLLLLNRSWLNGLHSLEGGYRGFSAVAKSVRRSFRVAGSTGDIANKLGGKAFASLCVASIQSLGATVPPQLLELALDDGLISTQQASHIVELQSQENKGSWLLPMARHLTEGEFSELIHAVSILPDLENRAQFLVSLAGKAPAAARSGLIQKARLAVGDLASPYHKARLLVELSALFDDADRWQALSEAEVLAERESDLENRARLVSDIVISAKNLEDDTSVARGQQKLKELLGAIPAGQRRAMTFIAVFNALPVAARDSMFDSILEAIETPLDVLGKIAPSGNIIEDARREALLGCFSKLRLLKEANSLRQKAVLDEVVSIVEPQLEQYQKTGLLIDLLPLLHPDNQKPFGALCFERTRQLPSANNRTHAMMKLASYVAPAYRTDIVSEALRNSSIIEDTKAIIWCVTALIEQLPPEGRELHLNWLWRLVSRLKYAGDLGEAMIDIAPLLDASARQPLYHHGVELLKRIADRDFRINALERALKKLPAEEKKSLFAELAGELFSITAQWHDLQLLGTIAGDMWNSEQLDFALQYGRSLPSDFSRPMFYSALIPIAARLGRQDVVKSSVEIVETADDRTKALYFNEASSSLPSADRKELKQLAVEASDRIVDIVARLDVVAKLAVDGFAPAVAKLKFDESIIPGQHRARCQIAIAAALVGVDKEKILQRAYANIHLAPEAEQADLLTNVALETADPQFQLATLDAFFDADQRSRSSELHRIQKLAPVIATHGGDELVHTIIRRIEMAIEWWP